jgi:ketosteroid isomerase-like protein
MLLALVLAPALLAGPRAPAWKGHSPAERARVQPQDEDSQLSEEEADSLASTIEAKEREAWDNAVEKDTEAYGDLMADDLVTVDSTGVGTKRQLLDALGSSVVTGYAMEDPRVLPISPNAGLIVYRITITGSDHGKKYTTSAYISALWVKRDERWVTEFFQETEARPASREAGSGE